MSPLEKRLLGRTIALPENRELDALEERCARHGAAIVRCPLVAIQDNPDRASVQAWLGELIAGRFDDLVLFTGEGLRRLLDAAERLGARASTIQAIARVRKITRGPKPARALKEIGLATDLPSAAPTTAGIIETLSRLDLKGRRVAVQLYGLDPNPSLVEFLIAAGATVHPVAPYVYSPASDAERVLELIGGLAAGRIDAIAFTSASQVDRLYEVAAAHHRTEELRQSLQRVKVAAVGPIVAGELKRRGARVDAEPSAPYTMASLVRSILALWPSP